MNEYTIYNNSNLVVQTDPTITFSNGMTLWLAKKGEIVEINQFDWDLLQAADQYIKRIGLGRYAPNSKICVAANPVPKEEDNSIFGSILRFLFGWME